MYEMIGGWNIRCNVNLDQYDDEFQFIKDNIKKDYQEKYNRLNYFDLSRMFNYFENNSKMGLTIDLILRNYKIEYHLDQLLKEPRYQALKISQLVDMVSMSSFRDNISNNANRIFNGFSQGSTKSFTQEQRRRQKQINN